MAEGVRRKSPRAPTMDLEEALTRALKAYDRERLHSAPTEVFAQNIGYKGANNGAALSAIASLRYFGLVDRPSEGHLAVAKSVEDYKYTADETHRRALLRRFLKTPPLYAELLENANGALPSDADLKNELIKRGFIPPAAETAMQAFRRSVDFAHYFDSVDPLHQPARDKVEPVHLSVPQEAAAKTAQPHLDTLSDEVPAANTAAPKDEELDRIPVRLPGGRRAWLVIPTPFFEGDKIRLKAQIDLLLTDEEDVSKD